MSASPEAGVDKLVSEFQTLVANAESILLSTASDSSEKATETRERIRDALAQAREQIDRVEEKVLFEAKIAAREADRFVRERPWQAVGIAAAVGLVIGVLVSRK